MATKTRISLAYGYTISLLENNTFTLKVETENETLEFDGINGNIYIASDFESLSDVEKEPMTLTQYITSGREFLIDWGVDETVADKIIKEITPWFKGFAIEEPTADVWEQVLIDRVKELEEKEQAHRKGISRKVDWFKNWVNMADESEIVGDAVYKAKAVADARETYRAVWTELVKAKSELEQYRETMHRQ